MQRKADSQNNHRRVYAASVKTPFANLGLWFQGRALAGIDFIEQDLLVQVDPGAEMTAEIEAMRELINSYCLNPFRRPHFDSELMPAGTEFQQKVWKALQDIPAGRIVTYGELAKELNTSARAVGNACRRNPIPVIIPCHRVVARAGIGGFSGATKGSMLNIKKWLLNHEGVQFS